MTSADGTTMQMEEVVGGGLEKAADLAADTAENKTPLTTNLGQPISTDQNSLRAGKRGPTLLEDFVLREKLQHFDHERIPERIVHARGAAAHGFFQAYESLAELTSAKVLHDPEVKTPVFVRFSTVAGSRGSADTARDIRGFAVKKTRFRINEQFRINLSIRSRVFAARRRLCGFISPGFPFGSASIRCRESNVSTCFRFLFCL